MLSVTMAVFPFPGLSVRVRNSGKVYICGSERLPQLFPVMLTKKYKPAMKVDLMEGLSSDICIFYYLEMIPLSIYKYNVIRT